MIDLPDPKAKELIDRASKDGPTKRLKKNIIKFLINFNIIGWAVSFMLAIQINNFVDELMKTILRKYKIENELVQTVFEKDVDKLEIGKVPISYAAILTKN